MITLVEQGQPRGQIVISSEATRWNSTRPRAAEVPAADERSAAAVTRPRRRIGPGSSSVAPPDGGLDLSEPLGTTASWSAPRQDLLLWGAAVFQPLRVYHLLERPWLRVLPGWRPGPRQRRWRSSAERRAEAAFEWRIVALFHIRTVGSGGMTSSSGSSTSTGPSRSASTCASPLARRLHRIAALAAAKLGVPIELTELQRQNCPDARVFDHAGCAAFGSCGGEFPRALVSATGLDALLRCRSDSKFLAATRRKRARSQPSSTTIVWAEIPLARPGDPLTHASSPPVWRPRRSARRRPLVERQYHPKGCSGAARRS